MRRILQAAYWSTKQGKPYFSTKLPVTDWRKKGKTKDERSDPQPATRRDPQVL
jgi:hypothetical protein